MTWTYPEHSETCGIYAETTCFQCLLSWPGTKRWSEKRVCPDCNGSGMLGEMAGRCGRCKGRGEIPEVPREVEQDVTRARRQ